MLELKNVGKNFKQTNVLVDVSFSISKNEIVALLGSNGTGKTTIINMILGNEIPTSGVVTLFGMNPTNPRARQLVGCTPQNVEFPEGIKTKEILEFVHGHYENPYSVARMIEKFNLSEFLSSRASKLSGGQKRRLALALAFIGNPKIVFLDEPTTGLDVASRKMLWEVVKEEVAQGKIIFLTTHYLEEVEQVANRVLFLQHGKIHFDGTVSEIKKIATSHLVKIKFFCEQDFDFAQFQTVENVKKMDEMYVLETYEPDHLLRELVHKNVEFKNLSIEKENLESAFLNLSQNASAKIE